MAAVKIKKRPPYDFILEELGSLVTSIKPMFGAFGLYRDHQILMILRKKEIFDNDTGMWLGVADGQYESIRKKIPELRDLEMFGPGPTQWQVLGEDLSNFEEVALQICDLIKKNDPRIGRTPKSRLSKKKKGSSSPLQTKSAPKQPSLKKAAKKASAKILKKSKTKTKTTAKKKKH